MEGIHNRKCQYQMMVVENYSRVGEEFQRLVAAERIFILTLEIYSYTE